MPKEYLIQMRVELSGISLDELRDIKGLTTPGAGAPAPTAPTTTAPRPARPGGARAAAGADFIVPAGFPRDSFNLGVTSGEHVLVEPRGAQSSTTNNVTINIAAISKDYTPRQAGDEILERMRSRGLIA